MSNSKEFRVLVEVDGVPLTHITKEISGITDEDILRKYAEDMIWIHEQYIKQCDMGTFLGFGAMKENE